MGNQIEGNRRWRQVGEPRADFRTILIDDSGDTCECFQMDDAEIDEWVEAMSEREKARVAWIAAGSPWSDDDEAFLNRMTGY